MIDAATANWEFAYAPARAIAHAIARRALSCAEALEMHIDRVERYDGELNAVVVRDFARARRRARQLDELQTARGPLHGVPMTVKESFDVAGLPTTYGLPEYARHAPLRSAVAVERLEAAGAVIFGKTNVPRLLLDWQSFNDVYGVTRNPWDHSKTPGGSSGGAAAALAAGLTALEIGSDIGGSIRVPAHMTGCFGHKPTWGTLPLVGHSLSGAVAPTDISVIGPLARSAGDLRLAMEILAGADPADSALRFPLPAPRVTSPAGLRVAVWPTDPAAPTDPEITAGLHELAEFLARHGAQVRFAQPAFDAAEAYELFLKLVASAIAPRLTAAQLDEARARVAAAPDDPGPDAVMDRAYGLLHREWLLLNERRHVLRRVWQSFFADFDVLICPPFATPALPHDITTPQRGRRVVVDGRTMAYNGIGFWAGAIGAYYLPATVAPLGVTKAGLPIGVQIVGAAHQDLQTIAVAQLLEAQWRPFVPPPTAATVSGGAV